MKKFLKKLSCALLAAAMVCAMTPLAASAAINYSKTRIVYMPTSGKDLGYDEISISNIPAKQNILKSNVKVVSGGSVIALDYFGSSRFKSTTELSARVQNRTLTPIISTIIGFAVKKPGTGKDFLQGRKQNLYFHHQGASLCQPVEIRLHHRCKRQSCRKIQKLRP